METRSRDDSAPHPLKSRLYRIDFDCFHRFTMLREGTSPGDGAIVRPTLGAFHDVGQKLRRWEAFLRNRAAPGSLFARPFGLNPAHPPPLRAPLATHTHARCSSRARTRTPSRAGVGRRERPGRSALLPCRTQGRTRPHRHAPTPGRFGREGGGPWGTIDSRYKENANESDNHLVKRR